MPAKTPIRYAPDYATSPGEVLESYLAARGMTKAELASRCGRPTKTISEIIHGKAAITPETALQLERVLGRPASLWQNLEANYRLRLAQKGEAGELGKYLAWAKRFPVRELVAKGSIDEPHDDADLVAKLFAFFGVGTMNGWKASFGGTQVAYRRSPSFVAAPESVSAWIRQGEILAEQIECKPFDEKAFRTVLEHARELTSRSVPDVWEGLVSEAATAGVAVALVAEFPKTHLSGIARWLTKDKALIQLSLRYKTNDHLWFSFFHEAGHLLLHGKKTIFVDEKGGDHAELEEEANKFARNLLIPLAAYNQFVSAKDFSTTSIKRFASQQRVGAGIVVGRLQHEGHLHYGVHNGLKERLELE